jgi:SAM-dependent methyltransferase
MVHSMLTSKYPIRATAPAPPDTAWRALLDDASEPYRPAGRFAYHLARGKLRADPVFRAILEHGLLQRSTLILDLGCGQALLCAWLRAAARCFERGMWPAGWPAATRSPQVRGIELKAREVARARCALGDDCNVTQGDICSADFGSADAVVILDVLHYIAADAQRDILRRIRAALPAGGLLLLRVGDAAAGLRFRLTSWVDKFAMFTHGHGWVTTYCRSVTEWRALLSECDFDSTATPMSHGTPFANVLLIAHAR